MEGLTMSERAVPKAKVDQFAAVVFREGMPSPEMVGTKTLKVSRMWIAENSRPNCATGGPRRTSQHEEVLCNLPDRLEKHLPNSVKDQETNESIIL